MQLPAPFGKFHLLERLAIGGMAEVFLAKSFGAAGFERLLVIKKILPHMSEDDEFITMFIDEARIASTLNHSNIIQINELGKEGTDYYIAMEFCHGRDLSKVYDKLFVQKRTVPIAIAVLIASRVCEGLEYAHRKKDSTGRNLSIIHRDISPGNVLISYDGDVKLIDFGIAKAANRMGRTTAGTLKGKFGYMSPEQVRGMPLDHRSDIFSVGILLYEMLTGERLFGAESDFGTLEKVRNAQVVPPTTYNKKIPRELERVVLRALARDPAERYDWASDMQEDLVRFLMHDGSLTTSKSLGQFMRNLFDAELARDNEKLATYRRRGHPWVDEAQQALGRPEPAPAPTPVAVATESIYSQPTNIISPEQADEFDAAMAQPVVPPASIYSQPTNIISPEQAADFVAAPDRAAPASIYSQPTNIISPEQAADFVAAQDRAVPASLYAQPTQILSGEQALEFEVTPVPAAAPVAAAPTGQATVILTDGLRPVEEQASEAFGEVPDLGEEVVPSGVEDLFSDDREPTGEAERPVRSVAAQAAYRPAPDTDRGAPALRPGGRQIREINRAEQAEPAESSRPSGRYERQRPDRAARKTTGTEWMGRKRDAPQLPAERSVSKAAPAPPPRRRNPALAVLLVFVAGLGIAGALGYFLFIYPNRVVDEGVPARGEGMPLERPDAGPGEPVPLGAGPVAVGPAAGEPQPEPASPDAQPATPEPAPAEPGGEAVVVATSDGGAPQESPAAGEQPPVEPVAAGPVDAGPPAEPPVVEDKPPADTPAVAGTPPADTPAVEDKPPADGPELALAPLQPDKKPPKVKKRKKRKTSRPHPRPPGPGPEAVAVEVVSAGGGARVAVSSNPAGAEILLNGRLAGITPKTIGGLDATRSYFLVLRKDGYKKSMHGVKFDGAREFAVSATLERDDKPKAAGSGTTPAAPAASGNGFLVANTKPWARVIIDGRDTGKWTPLVGANKLPLPVGKHKVTFQTKEGKSATVSVDIRPGQTAKVIQDIN